MTHLVSPTAFRQGKTFLWKTNSPLISQSSSLIKQNDLTLSNGIQHSLKYVFRRKRLFIVKGNLFYRPKLSRICFNVLYMPRVKTKPRSDSRGTFTKLVLYRNLNWTEENFNSARGYIKERRLKIHKLPDRKIILLNKWITRRMLRGSTFTRFKNNLKFTNTNRKSQIPKKSGFSLYCKPYKKFFFWSNFRWLSKKKNKNKLCDLKISTKISMLLKRNIHIKTLNIFVYMVSKHLIGYRSHQEHFWNKKFRHNRFFYFNYYDILNSFYILSFFKNTENLLLDILRMMMPRIKKIRRFLYFLAAVVKHLPEIQSTFGCFRITVTGKIRGGTQRTKTATVGFGHLPSQSLFEEGSTAFTSYRHKFGEFGVRLILKRLSLISFGNFFN